MINIYFFLNKTTYSKAKISQGMHKRNNNSYDPFVVGRGGENT